MYFKLVIATVFLGYLIFYLPIFIDTVKTLVLSKETPLWLSCILVIFAFFSIGFSFIDLYFLTYNIIGFIDYKKDYEITTPKTNFALLVFAHNEENVIESSLSNLLEIDYPKHLYEIFVIADNCSDKTVEICQQFIENNNIHVIVRTNDKLRGKQYAASDVINQIVPKSPYFQNKDAIVFLDADNHVNKQFLNEINSDFLANPDVDVIQAKLGVKNPNDNMVSRGYASTYNVFNRFYQFGKRNAEVNSHIGGTGFAVRKQTLGEVGWSTTSLTEDYEIAVKYTVLGKKIRWNHFAVIYDEKPTEMKASLVQRLRWVRGHWQVVFANFFSILKSRKKMGGLNWVDQISTALSLGKAMNYVVGVFLGVLIGFTIQQWLYLYVPLTILFFSYIVFLVQSYYVLTREEGEKTFPAIFHTFTYTIAAFIYNITFMVLHFVGIFTWRNKTWKRTEHKVTEVKKKSA